MCQPERKLPLVLVVFFFSSRRRHTRCYRDWSSDVCSSDLAPPAPSDCAVWHPRADRRWQGRTRRRRNVQARQGRGCGQGLGVGEDLVRARGSPRWPGLLAQAQALRTAAAVADRCKAAGASTGNVAIPPKRATSGRARSRSSNGRLAVNKRSAKAPEVGPPSGVLHCPENASLEREEKAR